jgi:hypothetical protein
MYSYNILDCYYYTEYYLQNIKYISHFVGDKHYHIKTVFKFSNRLLL